MNMHWLMDVCYQYIIKACTCTSQLQGHPLGLRVSRSAIQYFSEMMFYLYLNNIIPDTNTRLVPINTSMISNIGTLEKQFSFISHFLWNSEWGGNSECAWIHIAENGKKIGTWSWGWGELRSTCSIILSACGLEVADPCFWLWFFLFSFYLQ